MPFDKSLIEEDLKTLELIKKLLSDPRSASLLERYYVAATSADPEPEKESSGAKPDKKTPAANRVPLTQPIGRNGSQFVECDRCGELLTLKLLADHVRVKHETAAPHPQTPAPSVLDRIPGDGVSEEQGRELAQPFRGNALGSVKCNQCDERVSPAKLRDHKRDYHPATDSPRGADQRSIIRSQLKP